MTVTERKILKALGVESLGYYILERGTVVSIRFMEKKETWEEEEIKRYIYQVIPRVNFL